jgi:hypothetical protein
MAISKPSLNQALRIRALTLLIEQACERAKAFKDLDSPAYVKTISDITKIIAQLATAIAASNWLVIRNLLLADIATDGAKLTEIEDDLLLSEASKRRMSLPLLLSMGNNQRALLLYYASFGDAVPAS